MEDEVLSPSLTLLMPLIGENNLEYFFWIMGKGEGVTRGRVLYIQYREKESRIVGGIFFMRVVKMSCQHSRVLTVLSYPRNMVIYHYPPIGVICMVILHVFIIKNHPNFFSNYYPKYTIWVI